VEVKQLHSADFLKRLGRAQQPGRALWPALAARQGCATDQAYGVVQGKLLVSVNA
jgi:hypothetical protein